MDLTKELAKEAKRKDACKQGYDQLITIAPSDKIAMVQLYLRNIDFCLGNDYPSNEFIKANFNGVAQDMGVFVDERINVENAPKCVCLGATNGTITVLGFSVCEIFAKHDAKINIKAKDNSFVMVDLFDNAVINIHAFDRAKVCVNRYGGVVNTIHSDEESRVKIIEKETKSY